MINSFCRESGNKNVMGYDLSLTITDQRRGREGMARMDIRFALKQVIKQGVQNVVLPACYQVNRGRAVDRKLVVFADAHHNSRPAAMELLYRRLKKDGSWKIVEHYLDYGTLSGLWCGRGRAGCQAFHPVYEAVRVRRVCCHL